MIEKLIKEALAKVRELFVAYDFTAAESFCKQILKVDDKVDEAWLLLGIAYCHNQKIEEALKAFDMAEKLTKPENKEYVISLKEQANEIHTQKR